ncbi:MAG TPA: NAD-dependent epimerase/dehydratase family protein [Sphingomonas sp.]|uniref:SDR family oxidoreductase n=1 Tax=Sphingomonas sp. TaxID=28214 RepID=UPI002EDB08BE
MPLIAITGGTGFVGGHLLAQAAASGYPVRALTRQPRPNRAGVTWVSGTLDDPTALLRLVEGVDAVIHVAGLVNAADRAGFAAGNIAGTQAILTAASVAGVRRFIHVSSLAAREPGLSDYGWSKAEAERVVLTSDLDHAVVRPPAIYGPGDRDMFELFWMAARGVVLLPPGGRFSVIAAEDLARLLLTLVSTTGRVSLEPDDGTPNGWDHKDFARLIGAAVGRAVRPIALPRAVLRTGAALDRLIRRGNARLTDDRVSYMCHPDWVVHPTMSAEPWQPLIPTPAGLRATASWYRAQGWL